MKRGLFAVSKLFTGEDGFLSFGVLGGLTRRLGEYAYPPPPVLSSSSRNRWTVPDGTRSRECKLSTIGKHILTVSA